MSKKNVVLTVTVLIAVVFAAFAVQSVQAQESTVARYRTSMRGLLPIVDSWLAELNGNLQAVAAKPEVACSPEYQELVRRGGWNNDDFHGTGTLAPSTLASDHQLANAGLDQVLAGAKLIGQSCDGKLLTGGLAQVQAGQAQYEQSIQSIRFFTKPAIKGQVRPGSGGN